MDEAQQTANGQQVQEQAPQAQPAPGEVSLRWTPNSGNMTSVRRLETLTEGEYYEWHAPGTAIPVAPEWFAEHEEDLGTSPREVFEVVPA